MLTFVFFNDTATTEIYTLSLHDALPILNATVAAAPLVKPRHILPSSEPLKANGTPEESSTTSKPTRESTGEKPDRKSTRLNSSHANISYAVFCLKKKQQT